MPAFSLRGFDGGTVTEKALAGRPAVINFFASTCVFCIHEMPAFERVHARMGDRVSFLGVALRDSEPAARQLARETGVTYPLAFDDSGSFYQALRGFGMPVTAFILSDGSIASLHSGPLDEAQLQEIVDELIAGTG
jgi:thiol-disulfide isomerase/thioredoxin